MSLSLLRAVERSNTDNSGASSLCEFLSVVFLESNTTKTRPNGFGDRRKRDPTSTTARFVRVMGREWVSRVIGNIWNENLDSVDHGSNQERWDGPTLHN